LPRCPVIKGIFGLKQPSIGFFKPIDGCFKPISMELGICSVNYSKIYDTEDDLKIGYWCFVSLNVICNKIFRYSFTHLMMQNCQSQ